MDIAMLKNKKTILCYGDSNTWGYVPGTIEGGKMQRFPTMQRWPMMLQNRLGRDYHIIEAGLCARTTNIDDPDGTDKNGLKSLKVFLGTYAPLDLVVLMLGTNDLNKKYKRSAEDIAQGIEELIICIQNAHCGTDLLSAPEILLVVPPHLRHEEAFDGLFTGAIAISKRLPSLYQEKARMHQCHFLDVNSDLMFDPEIITKIDGIHLDAYGHQLMSRIIFERLSSIKNLSIAVSSSVPQVGQPIPILPFCQAKLDAAASLQAVQVQDAWAERKQAVASLSPK